MDVARCCGVDGVFPSNGRVRSSRTPITARIVTAIAAIAVFESSGMDRSRVLAPEAAYFV